MKMNVLECDFETLVSGKNYINKCALKMIRQSAGLNKLFGAICLTLKFFITDLFWNLEVFGKNIKISARETVFLAI